MRCSKIKAKLANNEPALCTQLHLTDPSVFELASLMGFDGLWMDLEHHGYSVETAGQLMRAARVGSADIVARPAKGEFMRMGRLLEMGAQAIMYPRCEDAEEAAEVVRWAKFAPLGRRGFDGGNADAIYTAAPLLEYLAHANRETFILIQLEEDCAVDRAEEIAATPGVDALLLGPADFSILGGFPLQFDHPKLTKAVEKVAVAARNTGKHWARTVGTPEQAGQALEMGARLLFHNADIVMLKRGLENIQSQFASLGFRFENRLKPSTT
ncbi:MAG TPA: aldolase/citrate lyase family protein [Pirellulales bacterium]|jgi:4-hydroxy-2-oxoheptanedioate aldolase